MNRVILIVLDGCGVGSAPDWESFDEVEPSNTIKRVFEANPGLSLTTLDQLGLRQSAFEQSSRLRPMSEGGKDSVTGHWELMGIVLDDRFPTYSDGFPEALRNEFESRIGRPCLWNGPASGTQIIAQEGENHLSTGHPIVYTSADSVFQIAAHEDIVPVEQLYKWCEIAREIAVAPDNVQRIIARPFTGPVGEFVRTERRRDYPLPPPPNLCDEIGDVYGIGVVPELFSHRGFRSIPRTQSNPEHEVALIAALDSDARFIFANFEDFDMKYGHRNDPIGFAQCLAEFDHYLDKLLGRIQPGDQLLITADHGNDPTTASTDHSREYVPLMSYPPLMVPDDAGMSWVADVVRNHLAIPPI
jgi:phosphopentomutase